MIRLILTTTLLSIIFGSTAIAGSEHRFSSRSLKALQNVNPNLVHVAYRALQISSVDFIIIEGTRTKSRQRKLVARGASMTMWSNHLTGNAIDVAVYTDGVIHWNIDDMIQISKAFKSASAEMGVELTWGGDWKTFIDMPHYEVRR